MSRLPIVWLGVGFMALIVVAFIQMWPTASQGYYHDESWRIDIVRSADPIGYMRELRSTPTAVGWVYVTKAMLAPFPYSYTLVRVISFVWFAVFVVATGSLLHRVGRVAGSKHLPWPVPVLTCGCLALMLVFTRLYSYFNNYMFEAAWLAVAMLLAFEVGRRRWAFVTLAVMIATAPLFVIGALLAVPGLLVRLVVEARLGTGMAWRWLIVAASGLCGALTLGIAYQLLYRHGDRTEPVPLDVFWQDEILGLSDDDAIALVVRTLGQLQTNLVGGSWVTETPTFVVVTGIVLLAVGAVGAVDLWRRWPWYVGIPLAAWLLVVPASAVAHIPMTAVRSNFAWMSLVYVIVAFGAVRSIWYLVGRWPVVAIGLAVVVIGGVLWHSPRPATPDDFARGLREDLELVAASPSNQNLVLSYHHMSQSYTHDVLINDDPPGEFDILREWSGDRQLYDDVDELIDGRMERGDALWCVIPFALGPEVSDQACLFDDDRLRPIVDRRGQHANIRGYLLE